MVTRRLVMLAVACAVAVGALAYLQDPPWLIDQTSGLRAWERPAGQPAFRWSGGHASFFVRADVGVFDMPDSTTFHDRDGRPMMVTVSVDDELVARVVLTDGSWTRVHVVLPPPGRRRVRRIDVRTNVTREGNHGVRIGALEFAPRVANKLLRSTTSGQTPEEEELDRYCRGAV
jgi:hypothetical protein